MGINNATANERCGALARFVLRCRKDGLDSWLDVVGEFAEGDLRYKISPRGDPMDTQL